MWDGDVPGKILNLDKSDRMDHVLEALAGHLLTLACPHPLRVAVDGIDCAGKSTLADGLAGALAARHRPVIRASVDDFLRPRTDRYQRGRYDPLGYYYDSFDYPTLIDHLLAPLGLQGDSGYRTTLADRAKSPPAAAGWETAPRRAILVCDGVFLQRPELDQHWDFRIYVAVSFEEALARALARDVGRLGTREEVQRLYEERYFPAQRGYLTDCQPAGRAQVVVWNDQPGRPRLEWKA